MSGGPSRRGREFREGPDQAGWGGVCVCVKGCTHGLECRGDLVHGLRSALLSVSCCVGELWTWEEQNDWTHLLKLGLGGEVVTVLGHDGDVV